MMAIVIMFKLMLMAITMHCNGDVDETISLEFIHLFILPVSVCGQPCLLEKACRGEERRSGRIEASLQSTNYKYLERKIATKIKKRKKGGQEE